MTSHRSSILLGLVAIAFLLASGVAVAVAAPSLKHGGVTISDPPPGGDGDGNLEPGETAALSERLSNGGGEEVTGLAGTLSSSAPGVTVSQPTATWPALAAGATEAGAPPFKLAVDRAVSCGATIDADLALSSDQGAATVPLGIPVGVGPVTPSADPGLPREISTSAGFDSTLALTGSGKVSNLRVSIPKLIHVWVGDVAMTLRSPAGTTVRLMSSAGGSGDDLVNVVFADDADTPISALSSPSPPGGFTGTYRPSEKLAAFDGEERAGTWTLHVWDTFPSSDSGHLHSWGIAPVGLGCSTPGNDAPMAVADAYSAVSGTTLNASSVLANDSDVDGDPLTAVKLSDPAHGTLALAADGTFSYTPTTGYVGPDTFSYRASDGTLTSATRTVAITVKQPNIAPVANPNSYSVVSGRTLSGWNVLYNDSDANYDPLTAIKETDPSHGVLSLNANGAFTYTPESGFVGTDSFTYRASDGTLTSQPATVTITVTANSAPVANADAFSVPAKRTLSSSRSVLGNDSDAEYDSLTAVKESDPSHGTLTLAANGYFTYVPAAGYAGTDSFTYHADDGLQASQPATVTITIDPNAAPVASPNSYNVASGKTLSGASVLSNDYDVNGDSLTAVKESDPSHGTLALSADGSFTYVPEQGYDGPDSFSYRADDGALTSAPATVTISVKPNTAPRAVADSNTIRTGKTLSGSSVLYNDTDDESDALTAIKLSDPAHGTVTLDANGTFRYISVQGYVGTDSFTYEASDGSLTSEAATVTITVRANSTPVARADTYSIPGNQRLYSGVTYNDYDEDYDNLTVVLESGPSHGTLTLGADGYFNYRADRGYVGPDSFSYHASDGLASSGPATVNIDVLAYVNRPPWASNGSFYAVDGTTLSDSLRYYAGDDDEDPIAWQLISGPTVGKLVLKPNGEFAYTAPAGYRGTTLAQYRVTDGAEWSLPATMYFEVGPTRFPWQPGFGLPLTTPVRRTRETPKAFANFRVGDAALRGRRLDVRAGISKLATGNVQASFRAGGHTTKLTAKIASGAVRVTMALTAAQRRSRTGVLKLSYAGNDRLRAETVKLTTSRRGAGLKQTLGKIESTGKLHVAGTIARRARGVVRVRLTYSPRVGLTKIYDYKASIRSGRWTLNDVLPAEAARARVQIAVSYDGDKARRISGAHVSQEIGG